MECVKCVCHCRTFLVDICIMFVKYVGRCCWNVGLCW